jgi:hypothetical protein
MRPTWIALRGAALLCAALSLAACSTPGPQRVVTRTELVEVPVRQLVPLPAELTADVVLPAAPAPAVPAGPGCDRPAGCLSSEQLEGLLADALHGLAEARARLAAIRRLQPKE